MLKSIFSKERIQNRMWHMHSVVLAVVLVPMLLSAVPAQEPETFGQAKLLAAQTRRLILLEFYRDD
jgi:hypothetical protein